LADAKDKILNIVFEEEEEIVGGLKKALSSNKVQRCTISTVEGKIKDFDINVFIGGAFHPRHFDEEYRLTSISGTFTEKGNLGYKGELTVSLAGGGVKMLGGDLLNAKASGELTIKAKILETK